MQILPSLGDTLASLRIGRGMTQMELAVKTGLHPSHISNYERGTHVPRCVNLIKLADAFEVSTEYLLNAMRNVPNDQ